MTGIAAGEILNIGCMDVPFFWHTHWRNCFIISYTLKKYIRKDHKNNVYSAAGFAVTCGYNLVVSLVGYI